MESLLQSSHFSNLMPHGMCYMWRWDLLLLHVGSDLLIAFAYFSIPAAMLVLLRKRPDIPHRIFLLFVAFILLCGITHLVSIVVVWYPWYWLQGFFKLATAIVSVVTAVMLWPLIPRATAMPSVTDLEKRNTEIEKLNRQLQNRVDSMITLAGGVSHQFNNLLTVINGNVELLQRSEQSPENAKSLDAIARSTTRAAAVSNQMLSFSGHGHFVLSEFDLTTSIRDLHLEAPATCKLTLDLANGMHQVNGSKSHISQLVMELYHNALEAIMEKGNENGKIKISAHQKYLGKEDLAEAMFEYQANAGEFVILEISDNGCGMKTEILDRAFDPYFSTKFTGRGLGLAAAQGIVKGHDACLFMRSEAGTGTTVRIAFPAVIGSSAQYRPATHQQPNVVLVVDDEPDILILAKTYLEKLGIEAHVASDCETAVKLAEQLKDRLQVLILDYVMPRHTGLEVLDKISKIVKTDTYLTSGYTRGEVSDPDIQALLTGFIAKPFQEEDFRKLFRAGND